mgnify:CR=1 FL=1
MKLLQWCGLPGGVINFVPCSGSDMSQYVVSHPKMAGIELLHVAHLQRGGVLLEEGLHLGPDALGDEGPGYVSPDDKLEETLAVCDSASPYALTGAIFAQDREAIAKLRFIDPTLS